MASCTTDADSYGKAILGIRDPGPDGVCSKDGAGTDSQFLGDFLLVKFDRLATFAFDGPRPYGSVGCGSGANRPITAVFGPGAAVDHSGLRKWKTELNERWRPLNRSERGKREFEGRTMPRFRFHPNASAMGFHYLAAKCKPNARAGNFLAVQALEHAEYELSVRRVNADAVISSPRTANLLQFSKRK